MASVSHEFRTPLTSIRGFVELLLADAAGELNSDQRRFLAVIARNSERLLRLVSDLLFSAQLEHSDLVLTRAPVELADLAHECAESARPLAEQKGITLEVEAAHVPAIAADRTRLEQLVDNLISNALKFTPPGGRVTVKTLVAEGNALVEVCDTGIGIPAAEREQLFERFFRASAATAEAIKGTGLGLSIVKAIIEGHGGRMEVDSEPGAGTTFRAILPLAEPQHRLPAPRGTKEVSA